MDLQIKSITSEFCQCREARENPTVDIDEKQDPIAEPKSSIAVSKPIAEIIEIRDKQQEKGLLGLRKWETLWRPAKRRDKHSALFRDL